MPVKRKKPRRAPVAIVPPFTGSVDPSVPAENVVLSHYVSEAGKWYAASQASDGRIFSGYAKTEPLARRAAGIRTLAHLQAKAEGRLPELTSEEKAVAREELAEALSQVRAAVIGFNGAFPATYPKEITLIELDAALKLVTSEAEAGVLSRWIAPPLVFLSGAFAEGIIGAYAEKALELLNKVLAG